LQRHKHFAITGFGPSCPLSGFSLLSTQIRTLKGLHTIKGICLRTIREQKTENKNFNLSEIMYCGIVNSFCSFYAEPLMAEPISIISDLQQVLSLMSPAYQLDVRRADTRDIQWVYSLIHVFILKIYSYWISRVFSRKILL